MVVMPYKQMETYHATFAVKVPFYFSIWIRETNV